MEQINFQPPFSKKERVALQQFLYRELIRISLLLDNNLTAPQLYGKMAALVKKVRYAVNADTDLARIEQLLAFFYQEQGFYCHHAEYYHSQNLMLNQVLDLKRGMPVSLGAVLLQLASVLDLPLYPVNFPTQLLLRAEMTLENGRKESRFIDLWNGTYLSFEQMEKLLEGEMGASTSLARQHLKIAEPSELLERLETVLKMALTREKKFEETLRVIEYRLQEQPDDPYEIRDRGMILASMECYQAAIEDLNYFIDQCPDDPSAMMLKMEIPALEKQGKAFIIH
ncbi:hypothetical protein EIM44_03125 [Bibersteinia trehalosi]|uniref:Protein SirB1 N-terminal domain-containing protein n=1 Tax=Bibersteinia trehalosi TaxID=47735 RepID=A0A3R8N0P8_BIBTR|nr:tetratricopeptide repeat protein [Bibersteinia trehalosi]AGH38908.1 hypothetical protein WQG_16310 [Bibersteinia trehalosi USDA-ARS-USMARC-192]RRN04448.1 hypothetical protein EIM44_03125 [Bibersteinia trehalosi]